MYQINGDSFFGGDPSEVISELEKRKPSGIEIIQTDDPMYVPPVTNKTIDDYSLFAIGIELFSKNGITPLSPIIVLTMNRQTLETLFDVEPVPSSYNDDGLLLDLKRLDIYTTQEQRDFAEHLQMFQGRRYVAIAPLCSFKSQLFGWDTNHENEAIMACQRAIEMCSVYHDTSTIKSAIETLGKTPVDNQKPGKCRWDELFFKRKMESSADNYIEVVPRTDEEANSLDEITTEHLQKFFKIHPVGQNMKYRSLNNLGHLAYLYVWEAYTQLAMCKDFRTRYQHSSGENEADAIKLLEQFLCKYRKYEDKPIRVALIISNRGKVETDAEDPSILRFEESNQVLEFKSLHYLMDYFIPCIDDGHVYLKFKYNASGKDWTALRNSKFKMTNPLNSIRKFSIQLFEVCESS